MLLLNAKQILFDLWKLWGILLLVLSACTPASSEATTPPTSGPTQTPVPTAISGPSYTNPVYKDAFADPHVLRVGDTYYAYATFDVENPANFQVIRSDDLVTWEELGDAMPALPEWTALNVGLTWAPGVIQIEDQFVMYYTARDKKSNRQCIGRAISDNPAGPFRDDSAQPFICQSDLGGSIDAYPFQDDDGKLYLLWKNDGNCCAKGVSLWIQELSPDGLTLQGEPIELIERDQAWEVPLIENPAMLEHNDKYYLFYSANKWDSIYYAVGYAVCDTVTGPCEKPLSEPWLKYNGHVNGPGGQSFFTDEEGNLWMAYHAWTGVNIGDTTGDRSLHIDLITFEGDKPITEGPTYTPQPLP